MTDTVVDRFHERISQGEIINNPCSYRKVSNFTTPGGKWEFSQHQKANASSPIRDYECTGPGSLTTWRALTLPPDRVMEIPNLPDEPSGLVGDAKAKALAHVDVTPYQFGEDIGELASTIRFLNGPANNVKSLAEQFFREYKRRQRRKRQGKKNYPSRYGRKPSVLGDLEDLSSVYLSYQFALLPLLRSINDAIAASLAEVVNPPRKTARGFSSAKLRNEFSEQGVHED
jgi:hypothetical protein